MAREEAASVRRRAIYGRRQGRARAGLTLLMLLAACAKPAGSEFRPLEPERALVRVNHPALDPQASVHSFSRDPGTGTAWYVNEVNGTDALGVVVASSMAPGHAAISRPTEEWVRSIIAPHYRIAWGTAGEAATSAGPLAYRLFSMGGTDGPSLACVAFSERRGPPGAGGQPRDVLYGYLCRYGTRPLERAVAEGMLAAVSVTP
jgi:hypothetical protein